MQIRRMTRLTNAYSKRWDNLRAMLALYFAHYNFVRPHGSLSGCTPAIFAGITSGRWTLDDLLSEPATQTGALD